MGQNQRQRCFVEFARGQAAARNCRLVLISCFLNDTAAHILQKAIELSSYCITLYI